MATKRKIPLKKQPAREPVVQNLPLRLRQPVGLLGNTFLQTLGAAPLGTPAHALILETVRAMAPEQLKAALPKATSKERSQFFSVFRGDQLQSVFGSFPVGQDSAVEHAAWRGHTRLRKSGAYGRQRRIIPTRHETRGLSSTKWSSLCRPRIRILLLAQTESGRTDGKRGCR
jgi:hypothetical protein